MATKPRVIIRHILAVLKLSNSVPALIEQVDKIILKFTGNADIPVPSPTIVVVQGHLDVLDDKETLALTKAAGAAADRDTALKDVLADMEAWRAQVQSIANAHPANAEKIIEGAGMQVKKVSPRQKQGNTFKDAGIAGSVILTGEGPGPHEWQQSPDNGTTIVPLTSTRTSKTTVNGLTVGSTVYFRNRQVLTKGRYGEWSQWIKVIVR